MYTREWHNSLIVPLNHGSLLHGHRLLVLTMSTLYSDTEPLLFPRKGIRQSAPVFRNGGFTDLTTAHLKVVRTDLLSKTI